MYNKSCKKQVTFNKCNILYYVCCVSCMIIIIVASCLPSYTFGVIITTCAGCMMLFMVHGSLISILCIIIESRCYICALAVGALPAYAYIIIQTFDYAPIKCCVAS